MVAAQPPACARPLRLTGVQPGLLNPAHLLGHRQLTDAYLLALAVHRQGRLVTLDGAVALRSVHGATPDHWVSLLP